MKFELTESQLSNLLTFMERVQLQGNEAMTFIEIVNKLQDQYSNQKIEKVEEAEAE